MAKLLYPGDTVGTTVSVSMPTAEDRGSPWVKAECSAVTTIREGESAKDARKRANKESWLAMERLLKKLFKEMAGPPE